MIIFKTRVINNPLLKSDTIEFSKASGKLQIVIILLHDALKSL